MTIAVRTKEWGNSIGVVLPKDFVREYSIKPGEELLIDIRKRQNVLKSMFGAAKFDNDPRAILKEIRKEESKWM